MKVFFGLVGVKGSGKTTTYGLLQKHIPDIIEITLANKLKNVCAKVCKLDRSSLDDPALKETPIPTVHLSFFTVLSILVRFWVFPTPSRVFRHIGKSFNTPRKLMQYVGTEILRSVDPEIHLKSAIRFLPKRGIFVVTDIRFFNELEFFHKRYRYFFFPLYIKNRNAEVHAVLDSHSSERDVPMLQKYCYKSVENEGKELVQLEGNLLRALKFVSNDCPELGLFGLKRSKRLTK